MRQVSDDFQVLRGLVKGRDWREYHVVDEYPNPKYIVVDTPDKVKMMEYLIEEAGEFAVDTEQCRGELWSVQISCKEGEAFFIPVESGYQGRVDLAHLKATAIVHYYLHDIQYVKLNETNFVDTMTQAYLVGQSQGLKELAHRLCGIQMVNYGEVVKPSQQKLSLEYLLKASGMEWPDPPTIEETKWDNKKGCLVTKNKKPWHISRKINKALEDYGKDDNTDLWDRWRNIPEEERAVVESVIGAMPESSLADIPFDDAVRYASRDADATLRVYHKLRKMISDAELDFIQYLDLAVLPQVNEMMQNGMPVDVPYLKELSEYYAGNMEVAAELASTKVGHPFNPNSSKQVAEVVYNELTDEHGNRFKPTKKTATGLISTDDQELKKVKHPVIVDILEYRRNLKNKSTFADALIEHAVPHEHGGGIVYRVHTTLKTTRTETGRLSSADPINLQTMPTRSADGKKIRKGFKASQT
jgi:DNA polymerase I-like protein with 3'-5' exonuclease and polymerase domains